MDPAERAACEAEAHAEHITAMDTEAWSALEMAWLDLALNAFADGIFDGPSIWNDRVLDPFLDSYIAELNGRYPEIPTTAPVWQRVRDSVKYSFTNPADSIEATKRLLNPRNLRVVQLAEYGTTTFALDFKISGAKATRIVAKAGVTSLAVMGTLLDVKEAHDEWGGWSWHMVGFPAATGAGFVAGSALGGLTASGAAAAGIGCATTACTATVAIGGGILVAGAAAWLYKKIF